PIPASSVGTPADMRVRATGATALAVTPYLCRPRAALRTREMKPPLAALQLAWETEPWWLPLVKPMRVPERWARILGHAVGDVTGRIRAVDGDAVVVDDEAGTLGGRRERDRAADAPPGSGDGDDLVRQEVSVAGAVDPHPGVVPRATWRRSPPTRSPSRSSRRRWRTCVCRCTPCTWWRWACRRARTGTWRSCPQPVEKPAATPSCRRRRPSRSPGAPERPWHRAPCCRGRRDPKGDVGGGAAPTRPEHGPSAPPFRLRRSRPAPRRGTDAVSRPALAEELRHRGPRRPLAADR